MGGGGGGIPKSCLKYQKPETRSADTITRQCLRTRITTKERVENWLCPATLARTVQTQSKFTSTQSCTGVIHLALVHNVNY